MKRKLLKQKLTDFGYSYPAIKKLLSGGMKPTATKMFELEDRFGIPVYYWKDIKSYLQEHDNTTHTDTSTTTSKKEVHA